MTNPGRIDTHITTRGRTSSTQSSVDPDKFLQALNVEEAEQADERSRKERSVRQEELEQEYDEVKAQVPVPAGLFKKYMMEPEKRASLYELNEEVEQELKTSDGETKISDSKIHTGHVDQEIKSNLKVSKEGVSGEELVDEGASEGLEEARVGENIERPRTLDDLKETNDVETPENEGVEEKQEVPAEELHKGKEAELKKQETAPKKETTTKELSGQEIAEDTDAGEVKQETDTARPEIKKESTKGQEEKPEHIEKKSEKKSEKKESEKHLSMDEQIEAGEESAVLSSAPITKQKTKASSKNTEEGDSSEEESISSSKEKKTVDQTEDDSSGDSNEREKNEEQSKHAIENSSRPDGISGPSHIEPKQMSPYSQMSSEVFEVYQKLVGIISLELGNGTTSTKVILNMPGSDFDKCELVLDQYDTAPGEFNIQFNGNPKAVEKFAKNMKNLNKAFSRGSKKYSVNLLTPSLSSEHSAEAGES